MKKSSINKAENKDVKSLFSRKKRKAEKTEKKPGKIVKTFKIVKNVFLGVIMFALLCLLAITLTARMNGETPTVFGYTVYRVSSGSMVPALQVGDIILCSECDPMTLKEGEIITYNGKSGTFAGKRVTHRVVKEPYYNDDDGQYYLLTKGDDNPVEDTPITVSQVTGKMLHKIEWLKKIYEFFVTPWGLLTLLALIIIAFFNEILNFGKALFGIGVEEEKPEDIQDIIARVQREQAEQKTTDDKQQDSQHKKSSD